MLGNMTKFVIAYHKCSIYWSFMLHGNHMNSFMYSTKSEMLLAAYHIKNAHF